MESIKDSSDVGKEYVDISYNRSRYNVHIPRQKLRELLIENVDPEKIRWSKKLTSFERASANNSDESVLLRFNDASEYNVSLLVGADGVFSTVYQLMLHRNDQLRRSGRDNDDSAMLVEDPMRLKYLGLMVVLGISPLSSSLLTSSTSTAAYTPAQAWLGQRQWLDGSTRVFTMPFDATKTMWQLSFPMDEESAMKLSTAATNSLGKDTSSSQVDSTTAGSRLKRKALEQVSGWAKELIDLMESTDDANISGHPVYDRDPISPFVFDPSLQLDGADSAQDIIQSRNFSSTLCTGLVTLLGDAAHPMSPFKGQGANQALVDAVQLCNALTTTEYFSGISKRRSVQSALRGYEKEMCKRSSSKVMKSREAALLLHQPAAVLA
eukprot:gene27445-36102_t